MHLPRPIADIIQLLTFEPIQCLFFLSSLHPPLPCIPCVHVCVCVCLSYCLCVMMCTYVHTCMSVFKHPLKPLCMEARCCSWNILYNPVDKKSNVAQYGLVSRFIVNIHEMHLIFVFLNLIRCPKIAVTLFFSSLPPVLESLTLNNFGSWPLSPIQNNLQWYYPQITINCSYYKPFLYCLAIKIYLFSWLRI